MTRIKLTLMRLVATCAAAVAVNAAYLRSEHPDRLRAMANIGGVKDEFESSATGGHVFTMQSIREFTGHRLDLHSAPDTFVRPDEESMCERWVVLTSIFDPTETVKQLGELTGWCVVVVGDKNGPTEYVAPSVAYLTPEDQDTLPYRTASILPWNHFGRKNVGYFYAVHHGAKVIYDVDDDNALVRPKEGVPYSDSSNEITPLLFLGDETAVVHNPYPCFGGPGNVWPRGFPLDAINENISVPCIVADKEGRDMPRDKLRSLGVLQSLANHDPDVDAIYRLTYPEGGLPFNFEDSPSPAGDNPLRIVPEYSMTPYNAQGLGCTGYPYYHIVEGNSDREESDIFTAEDTTPYPLPYKDITTLHATLHFPKAFLGMLLPVTVHGRVSDIWRSYFTQALLPSVGAVVAFAPAWVEQVRNAHDNLADFEAELPLYQKSGALAAFLVNYRSHVSVSASSDGLFTPIMERMETLIITMYEYGILEEADVELTQAWLQDLLAAGYVPPASELLVEKNEGPTVEILQTEISAEGEGGQEKASEIAEDSHKLLVIAVPSIRADRRQKIRETWMNWGDDRVALRFFTERLGDEQSMIDWEEELKTHEDLVILDIEPGMNFALKLLESMRWMSGHFTCDFFLRLDDDYFLCLDRLLVELDSARLAIYPDTIPPIYAGSLWCSPGKSRMDEAYMLLSRQLVDRVLGIEDLMCAAHGGTTAGYWFTIGSSANEEGDVLWLHDSRLVLYESLKAENRRSKSQRGATSVCEHHIGIHHTFADRFDVLWPAARNAEAATISTSMEPFFDHMGEGHCPSGVKDGMSFEVLQNDNAQKCSSFRAKGSLHYGKEGRPGN